MAEKKVMIKALQEIVVPVLRENEFKGSFPHFRRKLEYRIDLLSFQFDKWGGGFVIEISQCPSQGITTPWGKQISPDKVTVLDVSERMRLKPGKGGGTDSWFRYDQSPQPANHEESVARSVLPFLKQDAEKYWASAK